MIAREQAILNRVNADNAAELYRCRWSKSDAERVIPLLAKLLESEDRQVIDEALRALFRIGTPAAPAAPGVAKLTRSHQPQTKRLAVLALGQIAHKDPSICVKPLAMTLTDSSCCRDALRALAYMGPAAIGALEQVKPLLNHPDFKVRKAAVMMLAAIDCEHSEILDLLRAASADRSKVVREAADKRLRKRKRR